MTAAGARPLRLLALSTDIDATIASIRLVEPLAALARAQGHSLRLRSFHQATRADLAWADAAVVQRPTGARAQALVARLQAIRTPCICDIDDLLTDTPEFSMHHRALHGQAGSLMHTLQLATAITVPVEPLALALAQRLGVAAPPLHTVRNHGPAPRTRRARHDERLAPRATLVIASSDTVRVDFIVPSLRALAAEPGFQVLAVGPIAARLAEAGIALRAQPLLPRDAFLDLLAACVNPIGLIPLDDSPFSRCKSPIKFFDYAMAGVPALCSRVTPYSEVVDDRVTGRLVDNDAQAWQTAVLELAASAPMRTALVEAAAAAVTGHHNLAQSVAQWEAVLASVCGTARSRPPRSLSLSDRLYDAGDRVLVWLREINRARMDRRRKARAHAP
jgi:O-antigen biosynthesis protein